MKFNNLGLTLGMPWKFYTSVTKGLKLKVRKFQGPVLTFVEVTRGKTGRGHFWHGWPILNRVKVYIFVLQNVAQK